MPINVKHFKFYQKQQHFMQYKFYDTDWGYQIELLEKNILAC